MASAWERRNAAARAKGYRNYYDYRQHEYGRRPPAEPSLPGDEKRQRGHRGAAGLRRALKKGNVALVVEVPEHDRKGNWKAMRFIITTTDGGIDEYVVRPRSYADWQEWLDDWHEDFDELDIDFLPYGGQATQT